MTGNGIADVVAGDAIKDEIACGSPARRRVAIHTTAGTHKQGQQHGHVHEVILPMRTNLHKHEVPYGFQLAGITTGYRQGGTHRDCLLTLFTWHNQTLNSWTMIFGWLLSCWLFAWTWRHLQPRGLDLVAFGALWLCPTVHLPFTVGYHQFLCISPAVLRRWRALDVAFIFIASIPLTYGLSHFVVPLPYAVALTCVTLGLSLHAWHNAAALPAGADIDKKANTRYVGYVVLVYTFPILLQAGVDVWRALSGGGTATAGFSGSGDGDVADGAVFGSSSSSSDGGGGMCSAAGAQGRRHCAVQPYDRLYTLWCALGIVFCFAYGGAVYIFSFPDIFAPGVFDAVGAAQQLMHLAISGAQVLEWLFVIHMFQRHHHHHHHLNDQSCGLPGIGAQ